MEYATIERRGHQLTLLRMKLVKSGALPCGCGKPSVALWDGLVPVCPACRQFAHQHSRRQRKGAR